MKILIAPDKFKNSISATELARIIRETISKFDATIRTEVHVLADGGEGSLSVLKSSIPLRKELVKTLDPLGRPIESYYYTNPSNRDAYIELAKASGLELLEPNEYNPMKTSTYGTGLLIRDAISQGVKRIFLFIGGSATNDGGMGIAHALGIDFLDEKNNLLEPRGENLLKVKKVVKNAPLYAPGINITLLCDVDNILIGSNGAAHIFAQQKGAKEYMVADLEKGMINYCQRIRQKTNIDVRNIRGSGAAGGIAASLIPLFEADIKSGIETLMEISNFEVAVKNSDIIISGEGSLDSQSLAGKVISGVAQQCRKHKKKCILFTGKSELSSDEIQYMGVQKVYSVLDYADNLKDAMCNVEQYIKRITLDYLKTL
ncbi:MAG: glycerate kinase [Bacteroidota bacterium]